jgi:hypothetical protein
MHAPLREGLRHGTACTQSRGPFTVIAWLDPAVFRRTLSRDITGPSPMGAKLVLRHDAEFVMARPDRAIGINTMERAMERQAQAMTNKRPCRTVRIANLVSA